jgi:hypothetical protein
VKKMMTKPTTEIIEEAISEVEREKNVRVRCYPRWVDDGKFSRVEANDRMRRIDYALDLLKSMLKEAKAKLLSLTPEPQ